MSFNRKSCASALCHKPRLTDLADKTNLPAFWVPSLTPDDKGKLVKKPETKVVCPMTKKPLAMKHLITGNDRLILSLLYSTSCSKLILI